jgi:hypothetical protein
MWAGGLQRFFLLNYSWYMQLFYCRRINKSAFLSLFLSLKILWMQMKNKNMNWKYELKNFEVDQKLFQKENKR